MRVIPPVSVVHGTPGVDTIMTSTNVPEDDATAWTAGTYVKGTVRMYGHRVYEVVADPSTTDRPDIGAAADVATWQDLGLTNRWKMHDGAIGLQTVRAGTIEVSYTPGEIINTLCAFGLSGSSVRVTVTSASDGTVFDEPVSLQDNSLIVDGYSYCFNPIIYLDEATFVDLPPYGDATIEVVIDAGAETARCGELVLGRHVMIGGALFGTSVGIQSYSVKTEDAFGAIRIAPRGYVDKVEYALAIPTPQVAGIKRFLASMRDTPMVFIGDPARRETVVYGYYPDLNVVLSDQAISSCNLEVRGLV